jgi:hypothetical protein
VIGASLSRWTLSYFAAALVALVASEVLMAAGYGYPAAPIQSLQTFVLVHLVALGWLSLLLCGALFQFVPVLVARPLFSDALPLPALVALLCGIAALIGGFLQLEGQVGLHVSLLPTAAVLLAFGFALVLWNLGRTLWSARPLPIAARFVVTGLLSLAATVGLGMIFALVLGGAVASERLSALTISGLPIHVIVGLGGWLTFTAVGVSYRLLSMFMLAPELEGATTRATFHVGSCALAAAVVGGVGAICFGQDLSVVLLAVGALGLVAVALYGRDMLHLYRERKRRTIELNCRMAAMALVSLALAVVLLVIASATGNVVRWIGAILFLLAFGWLTGLALAKLYKIVPFLTWLECCGPVLGKQPTPRVQDLVVEKRALKWFLLYYAAVWSGTVVLLLDYGVAFRVPAALMLIATLGIIAQLLRARRLSDLKSEPYREFGLRRPGLLLSTSQRQ